MGLTHPAKRRLLHSKWWSQLLPPSLSSRAWLVPWLSWPLQPLHGRSAVQAPLWSGELCAAPMLPGHTSAAWRKGLPSDAIATWRAFERTGRRWAGPHTCGLPARTGLRPAGGTAPSPASRSPCLHRLARLQPSRLNLGRAPPEWAPCQNRPSPGGGRQHPHLRR